MDCTPTPGRVVWHELRTPDLRATASFYGPLLGWTVAPAGGLEAGSAGQAHALRMGDVGIAGLAPDASHTRAAWQCHVSVDDVAATLDRTRAGGGRVLSVAKRSARGELAVIEDPQGATLAVCGRVAGDPPEVAGPGPGTLCWDQLCVPAPDPAARFYRGVFGWSAASMGEGTTLFKRGARDAASMVCSSSAPARWLSFAVVDRLERACTQVRHLGGQVHNGEVRVPGVGTYAVIRDLLGAELALFEPAPRQVD